MPETNTHKIINDSIKETEKLTTKYNNNPSDSDTFLRLMFLPLKTATQIGNAINKSTDSKDKQRTNKKHIYSTNQDTQIGNAINKSTNNKEKKGTNKKHNDSENQAPQNTNLAGRQLSRQSSIGSFGL